MAGPDLPEKPDPRNDSNNKGGDFNLWRFFGMGIQLALTVAVFAALGWWLDDKFGWKPWGLLGFSLFGVAAGMYQFLKASL